MHGKIIEGSGRVIGVLYLQLTVVGTEAIVPGLSTGSPGTEIISHLARQISGLSLPVSDQIARSQRTSFQAYPISTASLESPRHIRTSLLSVHQVQTPGVVSLAKKRAVQAGYLECSLVSSSCERMPRAFVSAHP